MRAHAQVIHMEDHRKPGPQLEDGFVRIANELYDAILSFKLTFRQTKVLLAVLRKTYGYGKKSDDVSASQLGKMCAMPRPHVASTLVELEQMNVLNRTPGKFGTVTSINKDYREWRSLKKREMEKVNEGFGGAVSRSPEDRLHHYVYRLDHEASETFYIGVRSCDCTPTQDRYKGSGSWSATVHASEIKKTILSTHDSREEAEDEERRVIREMSDEKGMGNRRRYVKGTEDVLVQNLNTSSTDSVRGLVQNMNSSVVQKTYTQKTTFQKTTSKDNPNNVHPAGRTRTSTSPAFDAFWSAYPRKDKKADALKAFAKLAPSAELLADMVARVELLKQTDDWLKDAGQFVPLAASWLNGRRWEDEVPLMGYTADELRVIDTYNRSTDGTEWPEAKAAPYSRERAGLIRTFLGFLAKGAESVEPYFRRVAESVPAADTTGLDWLLRRETYLKIREGVHRQRAEV